MEGRIPTGKANLSTSSLYYGALLLAIDLGKELAISKKQLKHYKNVSPLYYKNEDKLIWTQKDGFIK